MSTPKTLRVTRLCFGRVLGIEHFVFFVTPMRVVWDVKY